MIKTAVIIRADKGEAYTYRLKIPFYALGFKNLLGRAYLGSSYLPLEDYLAKDGTTQEGVTSINPDIIMVQRQYADGQVEWIQKYILSGYNVGHDLEDNFWNSTVSRSGLENLHKVLDTVTFSVVPTEALKEVVREHTGIESRVLPTFVGASDFERPRRRRRFGKLKVGCILGQYVPPVIFSLINETNHKYEWHVFGSSPVSFRRGVKTHPIGNPEEYMALVSDLNLGVAILATESNKFTDCKSHLPLLQLSALGIPTICSNVTPYKESPTPLIPDTHGSREKWEKALEDYDHNETDRENDAWRHYIWAQEYTAESEKNSKLIEAAWTA